MNCTTLIIRFIKLYDWIECRFFAILLDLESNAFLKQNYCLFEKNF